MDETLFVTALVGILSAIITELSKKSGIKIRYLLVVPVLFFATGYTLFYRYVPEHIIAEIAQVGFTIMGVSVFTYEFLLKHISEKISSNTQK